MNSASVGIALVMATVIGLAGGYYGDRWLGTAPWLMLMVSALASPLGSRACSDRPSSSATSG